MRAELPSTLEEAKGMTKDYQHTKMELTKAILTTKLKNIRTKYRKAVDAGKKSGYGRVILIFYELCEKIWGGSPATTQIQGGVESTDLVEDGSNNASTGTQEPQSEDQVEQTGDDTSSVDVNHDNQEGSSPEAGGRSNDSAESTTIQRRKDQLDNTLRTYRHAKMNKRLPPDSQITGIAKEELELKKRMVEQIDRMDKVHQDHLKHLSAGMDKINTAIESFASILRSMIPQQPQFYHHMAQHPTPMHPMPQPAPMHPMMYLPNNPGPSTSTPVPSPVGPLEPSTPTGMAHTQEWHMRIQPSSRDSPGPFSFGSDSDCTQ